MSFRSSRAMVLIVIAALSLSTRAQGQATPGGGGAVTGLVRDAVSGPLPGAGVLLDGTGRAARTDSTGRFRLDGVAAGSYRISIRHVGYRPATRSVTVDAGTVEVLVEMEALPQALEALTVTRRRALLPEVHAREDAGLGAVLYAEAIPHYRQGNVSGLLRFVPALAAQVAGTKSCAGRVAYLIDGRPVPRGWDVDGMVRPEEIQAIEAHGSADFLKESRLVQEYVPVSERPSTGFGPLRLGAPGSPRGLRPAHARGW